MTKPIAAIFDIDGTIFRDSLLLHHLDKCVSYDVFPQSAQLELKPFRNAWENRELDYDDYLESAASLYTKYLTHKNRLDVEFVARKVIEKESKKLYRYTRERISWHKEQGHQIIFISGSPDFLVEKMATKLGADQWYATSYLTSDGLYTGKVIPMWDSVSKKQVINQLSIDFKNSYAYGDTTGDFTMLQSVGFPTAINPNRKLLDMIEAEKLPCNLIVERKDVVYTIKEVHFGLS